MASRKQKSKKLYDTRRSKLSKQLKSVVFFLERSLEGKIVLEELQQIGARVKPHLKYFKDSTPDPVWLKSVGAKRWIVLMRDKKIGRNELEKLVLLRSGVRAFVLISGELVGKETAKIIIKALPDMLEFIKATPAPFLAKIYKDSSIHRWL